jgi:phosphatidate phosphatase APP1
VIDETVRAVRHPRRTLGKAVRSAQAARLVSDLDRRLSHYRRDRKFGAGSFRGIDVVVHRGYVVGDEVRVHLRVLEEPATPEAGQGLPFYDVAKQNMRRYGALGLPQVDVVVRVGEVETQVTTERRGYAATTLTVPGLQPGWHRVDVTLVPDEVDADAVTGRGRVLVPDPEAPFAVISDIDDTGDAEGVVASLPSFFYVSTGSWAMYPLLTKFLQGRGFPRGPLFLTDWGPTDRYIVRSGKEHKRNSIGRLLNAYPSTRFVLIGDSGQGDPEVYLEIAGSHPTQVAAIVIIDVGPHLADRAEQLTARATEAQANGVQFHFVPDALAAAEVAQGLGFCDRATIDEVETELLGR